MSSYRKYPIFVEGMYHLFNKSIANFEIFHSDLDYSRMKKIMQYYSLAKPLPKFSRFLRDYPSNDEFYDELNNIAQKNQPTVQLIAYCFMPTHIHLVLKELKEGGISYMISNMLNGYARYFNTKYNRRGPLWVGRFKNVPVNNDEQLFHVTRYVHLNPVAGKLVKFAENWPHSSYREYIDQVDKDLHICQYDDLLSIPPLDYKKEVELQAPLQRELAGIKRLALE